MNYVDILKFKICKGELVHWMLVGGLFFVFLPNMEIFMSEEKVKES